jgi:hypothetical protein
MPIDYIDGSCPKRRPEDYIRKQMDIEMHPGCVLLRYRKSELSFCRKTSEDGHSCSKLGCKTPAGGWVRVE